MPDPYILLLTGLGVLIALVAWLPLLLRRAPLSLPIICIAFGFAVFSLPLPGDRPLPIEFPVITERLSEFVVIIALMGAGLKLDRVFGWRRWAITWRLLAVTMSLSILAIAALGQLWLGLSFAAAMLLAATLAPTDPVLAADVQVGPPKSGEEDEVRFGLTSEAGLNDGLAFPFVHLAIAASLAAGPGWAWVGDWFAVNVLWEIAVGVAAGWAIGWLFGWLTFHMPFGTRLEHTGDGFIALSATFVSYGVTEILHSYGFLAVFVTALAYRHAHRGHAFHESLHDFTEQVERLAMMIVLVLFGAALAGGLLAPLTLADVLFALAVLLLVRPLAGLAGLAWSDRPWGERLVLSFFGIRGIGSIYYLAYGFNAGDFDDQERLWAIVGLIVLLSVLMHGITVTPMMRGLDRAQGRDPDAPENIRTGPPGLVGPVDADEVARAEAR